MEEGRLPRKPPAATAAAPKTPPRQDEPQQVDEEFLQLHPSPAALEAEPDGGHPAPAPASLTADDLQAIMESLQTPSPAAAASKDASPPRRVPSPIPADQPILVPPTPLSPMAEWAEIMGEQIEGMLAGPAPAAAAPAPQEDGAALPIRPDAVPEEAIPHKPKDVVEEPSLPANDPRFGRSRRTAPPRTAAAAEVDWMRRQARSDPTAERRRRDVLRPLDFGVTVRLVTETARFPDGREFRIEYTEYNLPSKPVDPYDWTTPEHRRPEF